MRSRARDKKSQEQVFGFSEQFPPHRRAASTKKNEKSQPLKNGEWQRKLPFLFLPIIYYREFSLLYIYYLCADSAPPRCRFCTGSCTFLHHPSCPHTVILSNAKNLITIFTQKYITIITIFFQKYISPRDHSAHTLEMVAMCTIICTNKNKALPLP